MPSEAGRATLIRYPLSRPMLGAREADAVAAAVSSGWVSSSGPEVELFERAIAERLDARAAVATANGTAALHLALLCAGVEPGSEVIVPALTFVASVNAIAQCGAVPVFVDVERQTGTLSPAALDQLLRERYPDGAARSVEGRPLRAVLAVDLYGHPFDYEAVLALTSSRGVPIIEDAAEALGSTCRGRAAGRLGAAGVLSFNGNKIITTGGGGMVVTDDVELAARARHLSTQARSDPLRYEHDAIGFNYRLPNLNAALGLAQLERLDELLAAKRRIADGYAAAFGGVEGVELLAEQPWAHSNHWLVAALLPVGERDPDAVLARCDALGVEARRFFVPAHELPMYRQCPRGSLEVTDDLGARGVNLPSSPDLDATAPAVIAERLAEALAGVGTS